jgi:hypothetical protein
MQNKSSKEDIINLGYKVKPQENVTILIYSILLNGNTLAGDSSAASGSEGYQSCCTGSQHQPKTVTHSLIRRKLVERWGKSCHQNAASYS